MDLLEKLKRPDGKTLEFKRDLSAPEDALETIVALREAIESHVASLREQGESISEPRSSSSYVELRS